MKKKLLIIGKTPPPIGGVTIHVQRLLGRLNEVIPANFSRISYGLVLKLPFILPSHEVVHIHASNPYFQLLVTFLSRLLHCKSILTIHRELGVFQSSVQRWTENTAIKLASKVIVLNQISYKKAIKLNKNSEIVSAFIPPACEQEKEFSSNHLKAISNLKQSTETLFCTNAFSYVNDDNGNELYGITEIIDAFKSTPKKGLVFLDPSGTYSKFFSSINYAIPENILIIQGPNSFYRLLKLCDGSIRNTSTDGDALSIKESLYLGKITLATDVIDRPKGTLLYSRGQLHEMLEDIENKTEIKTDNLVEDGSIRLVQIYEEMLDNE